MVQKLSSFGEKREDSRLKRLEEQKKKLIKELKDSTRFDKISSLLTKYDPDSNSSLISRSNPPAPLMNQNQMQAPGARGTKAGAGLLDSALDSVSKFAQSIMGDNPSLISELERASRAADQLKSENAALQHQLEALKAKYEPQEARVVSSDLIEGGDATTVVAISKSSSFASIKTDVSQKEEGLEVEVQVSQKALRNRKKAKDILIDQNVQI